MHPHFGHWTVSWSSRTARRNATGCLNRDACSAALPCSRSNLPEKRSCVPHSRRSLAACVIWNISLAHATHGWAAMAWLSTVELLRCREMITMKSADASACICRAPRARSDSRRRDKRGYGGRCHGTTRRKRYLYLKPQIGEASHTHTTLHTPPAGPAKSKRNPSGSAPTVSVEGAAAAAAAAAGLQLRLAPPLSLRSASARGPASSPTSPTPPTSPTSPTPPTSPSSPSSKASRCSSSHHATVSRRRCARGAGAYPGSSLAAAPG